MTRQSRTGAAEVNGLPSATGHSKLGAMNFKPAFPMVLMTMAMQMAMSCCAEWNVR